MATADKTSLENKHLRNDDYSPIIPFCQHSIFLTNYATGGIELNIENENFNVVCSRCR